MVEVVLEGALRPEMCEGDVVIAINSHPVDKSHHLQTIASEAASASASASALAAEESKGTDSAASSAEAVFHNRALATLFNVISSAQDRHAPVALTLLKGSAAVSAIAAGEAAWEAAAAAAAAKRIEAKAAAAAAEKARRLAREEALARATARAKEERAAKLAALPPIAIYTHENGKEANTCRVKKFAFREGRGGCSFKLIFLFGKLCSRS